MSFFFSDLLVITKRNFLATWSMPIWIVFSAIYPILWLVLFGGLFSNLSIPVTGINYLTFFLPAMLATTTVFGALWSGFGILFDQERGILKKIKTSPVSPSATILGYVIASLSGVVFQIIVILFIAYLQNIKIDHLFVKILPLVGTVLLLGFGLSSFSYFIALTLKNQQLLITIVNFISLPMLFLSSALFPLQMAPKYIQIIARANPLEHATILLRKICIPNYIESFPIMSVIILIIFAFIMYALAFFAYKKD